MSRGIVGADDSALRSRPRAHRPGRHGGSRVPQLARPGAAHRTLGLQPLLAGRAPQHAGHRQRRHRGADRPRRRRHLAHPRRRRRHHAAQPRAAAGGRAVRRRWRRCFPAASTWGWAAPPAPIRRRRWRCAATLNSNPDDFPDDVLEVMAYFREPATGQRVRAVPGAGHDVPIWILGSSTFGAQVAAGARPAVLVRVALRAGAAVRRAGDLPRPVPAVAAAGPART